MGELLNIINVILLSSVKLALGSGLAIAAYKYNFWETWLFTSTGGILGIIAFTYISRIMLEAWHKTKVAAKMKDAQHGFLSQFLLSRMKKKENKKKPIFTKRKRFIIKWKKQYGLAGLAFLTPVILTIPIGTFICNRFFHNQKQVILYLVISTVAWSATLALFTEIRDAFKNHIIPLLW